jgi:hypothetical protein
MNTKKTAITIVAAMMAIAMITVAMAATCDEPCGTKVTQCTDDAPTKDAVYALILPGVTGLGTATAAVPPMQVGYVDIWPTNNQFDVGECAYIDTNSAAAIVQTGDVRLCDCCGCLPNTVVGQCICPAHNELGTPLTYPVDVAGAQTIVGYVDTNVNGVYDIEDPLYLDMDVSGTISIADIRLTGIPGYGTYSVVTNGDSDLTLPIATQLWDPATNVVTGGLGAAVFNDYLGFIDSSCDGEWTVTGEDKLYLQQLVLWPSGNGARVNQFDAFVTIGDFRLYMPPNEDCWYPCGTKVVQCDLDAVYAFLIPGISGTNPVGAVVVPMQFRWVDGNGDGIFDPADDNAYIDTDSAGVNVEMGDVRLTDCCGCPPNTMVGVCGTCDLSPPQPFAPLTQQDVVGYFDVNGNGVYDLEDPLYLDIGGIGGGNLADGVISPGDVRLTDAFGYDAWSVVATGDDDCPLGGTMQLMDPVTYLPMTVAPNDGVLLNDLLGFIDSECDGIWDFDHADDKLYLQQMVGDVPIGGAGPVNGIVPQFDLFATIGDLRLFIDESKVGPGPGEPCWLECGTKVEECDVDAVYGLTIPGRTPLTPTSALAVSAMQFGFVDKDGNGFFSLIHGGLINDCAYIDTNMVDLNPGPGVLYRVAIGDVRLCSCCDEIPNTVVEACDADELGQVLTIPIDWTGTPGSQMALVGYVDINADPFLPGYDVGEPLYLDCGGSLPLYADGIVSAGDIRLTGRTDLTTDYLPYSVVQSGDLDAAAANKILLDPKTDIPTIDILTFLIPTLTFNDYLGFRDSNCDGEWDINGGDELYLQQIVPSPDPTIGVALPNDQQFNLFSTIGDFRIYMPPTVGCPQLEGDVNNDGNIDGADALLTARHIVGITTLTGNDFNAADVNDDSIIDGADTLLIARYIVGIITTFPGGVCIP